MADRVTVSLKPHTRHCLDQLGWPEHGYDATAAINEAVPLLLKAVDRRLPEHGGGYVAVVHENGEIERIFP